MADIAQDLRSGSSVLRSQGRNQARFHVVGVVCAVAVVDDLLAVVFVRGHREDSALGGAVVVRVAGWVWVGVVVQSLVGGTWAPVRWDGGLSMVSSIAVAEFVVRSSFRFLFLILRLRVVIFRRLIMDWGLLVALLMLMRLLVLLVALMVLLMRVWIEFEFFLLVVDLVLVLIEGVRLVLHERLLVLILLLVLVFVLRSLVVLLEDWLVLERCCVGMSLVVLVEVFFGGYIMNLS